jgi:hypothetical protein
MIGGHGNIAFDETQSAELREMRTERVVGFEEIGEFVQDDDCVFATECPEHCLPVAPNVLQ